jgi:uncharacterized membrane protein YeiH
MSQKEIDEMFRVSREGVKAYKRKQRRAHPIRWVFDTIVIAVFCIVFAAIAMTLYTHPMQP